MKIATEITEVTQCAKCEADFIPALERICKNCQSAHIGEMSAAMMNFLLRNIDTLPNVVDYKLFRRFANRMSRKYLAVRKLDKKT